MMIHINQPRELASIMDCDHLTIVRHLHSMSKVQKLVVCVPHVLNENNICAYLLARHSLVPQQR